MTYEESLRAARRWEEDQRNGLYQGACALPVDYCQEMVDDGVVRDVQGDWTFFRPWGNSPNRIDGPILGFVEE